MEEIVVLDDKSKKLKMELDEVKIELRVAQKELDSLKLSMKKHKNIFSRLTRKDLSQQQ